MRFKNNIAILFIVIISFHGCAINKYFLFSYSDYEKQETYYLNQRFIIVPDSILLNDKLIDFAYKSIKNGEQAKLKDMLEKYDTKKSDSYYFSLSLFLYFDKKYEKAVVYLKKIRVNELKILSLLMEVDCEYEMMGIKSNNEIYYLKKLQNIITNDSTSNKYLDFMIKQREKNIKYGT